MLAESGPLQSFYWLFSRKPIVCASFWWIYPPLTLAVGTARILLSFISFLIALTHFVLIVVNRVFWLLGTASLHYQVSSQGLSCYSDHGHSFRSGCHQQLGTVCLSLLNTLLLINRSLQCYFLNCSFHYWLCSFSYVILTKGQAWTSFNAH